MRNDISGNDARFGDEMGEDSYERDKGTHTWILVVAIAATIGLWIVAMWYFGFLRVPTISWPAIVQWLNESPSQGNGTEFAVIAILLALYLVFRPYRIKYIYMPRRGPDEPNIPRQ